MTNRPFAVGVMLVALLCPRASEQIVRTAAPAPVFDRYSIGTSRWVVQEKERATAALSRRPVDVLVAPFRTDGDSFDAVERSLMTRAVAERVRAGEQRSVADPTLVEQALGSPARFVPDADVFALADRLQATTVVLGSLGHDNSGKFHVRVESVSRGGSPVAVTNRRTLLDLRAIPFDDTRPPFQSFVGHLDEIVDHLGGTRAAGARPAGATQEATIPPVPSSLAELERAAAQDPLQAAYLLQFLGVLHPTEIQDRARDGLFERSLLTLARLPDTPETRALKARAWGYLNRRPVAMQLLNAGSEEETAIRFYLDGDLEHLSSVVPKIGSPLPRLLATIELERLRTDYGGASNPDLSAQLAKQYPYWAPVLTQALIATELWTNGPHPWVKLALDAYWPNPKHDLSAFVRAAAATGKLPSNHDVAQLAYQHLEDASAATSEPGNDAGPRSRDVVELLRAMFVADVVVQLQHLRTDIGKPDEALAEALVFEPLLTDQPDFVIDRGWAEFEVARERPEPERGTLQAAAFAHLRQGAIWSQGQTAATAFVLPEHHLYFPGSDSLSAADAAREFFDSDWPNLPGWHTQTFNDHEAWVARLRHCVDYTIERFTCLAQLAEASGSREDAATILAANQQRFLGNPNRIAFLAREQRAAGNADAAAETLRSAIDAGTKDWDPYLRVGVELAQQGKPREALAVFTKYPGFKDRSVTDDVTLSNRAYDVGNFLYWAGAYEQARPLYEFAAALDTGSQASITSAIRLALLDRDLETALAETKQRARRYGSPYALRDLMMLSAALGDRATARAVFDGMQDQLDEPEFWIGPFMVQRMEGASLETIAQWATQGARSAPRTKLDSLAMRHLFLSEVTDRDVTDTLADTLHMRDPGPFAIRDQKGRATWQGRPLMPSAFFYGSGATNPPALQPGPLDSRLTMAARGLAALARADYRSAFDVFEQMSEIYELQEFLPYYAWAAAQIDQTARIERYLANALRQKQRLAATSPPSTISFFDEFLSLAILRGFAGETDVALDYLVRTNADVQHTEERALLTRYEIADVAEILYDHGHERRYKDFLLDLARRNSQIDPAFSWPYAFVAKYSDDASERTLARARALYLDPRSKRALAAVPKELADARRIISARNPLSASSGQAL